MSNPSHGAQKGGAVPWVYRWWKHASMQQGDARKLHQINAFPLGGLQDEVARLRIRHQVERHVLLVVLLVELGASGQEQQHCVAVALACRVMQRRHAVHVRRVQRALCVEQGLHHGHVAHGRGTVQRELAAPVLCACAGGRLVAQQRAGNVEVGLGGAEVQRRLAVAVLRIHIRVLGQQQVYNGLGVLARTRHHQRRPPRAVGHIGVKVPGLHERLHDGDVVVRDSPVQRQPLVRVA
jgi:hypothetical protein